MRILALEITALLFVLQWTTGICEDATIVEGNTCLVCGEGGKIDNGSKVVITTLGMFTCAGLAGAGIHGNISEDQCSAAKAAAVEKCGCLIDGEPTTDAGEDSFYCHICPNEGVVTIPEGVVSLPNGDSSQTCGEYLVSAVDGLLTEDECSTLQEYTNKTCGCTDPADIEDLNRPGSSNTTYYCHVCGEGMVSSDPDAIVSIPSESERTCSELEEAGAKGEIPSGQCGVISSFVAEFCSCQAGSPIASAPTRSPSAYDCPICGSGNVVTLPDSVVTIPTQPNRTCQELLQANLMGNINELQCGLLQPFVTAHCGCTPLNATAPPTMMPSQMPSPTPTAPTEPTVSPAPTGWATQKSDCYDSLMDIYDNEKAVDASIRRRYILCPNTTFNLGYMDEMGYIKEGEPFLMLRPNVIYQCGDDGSRQNGCILKGGDFGLASFYGVYDGIYESVENVRIVGLTFQSQDLVAAVMEAAGDIEFIDCMFKVSNQHIHCKTVMFWRSNSSWCRSTALQEQSNLVPVLMQWKGSGPLAPAAESSRDRKLRQVEGPTAAQEFRKRMKGLSSDKELQGLELRSRRLQEMSDYNQVVTFQSCIFRENVVTENLAFPGIIENSFGSELNIINCLFESNTYGEMDNPAPSGYAVRSYGPIHVESTCFIDNEFYAYGPIQLYGASHTGSRNFVKSSQGDVPCEFLAIFSNQDDTSNEIPFCFDADEMTCPLAFRPTPAPSLQPQAPIPTSSDETTTVEQETPKSSSTHVGVFYSALLASVILAACSL